MPPVQRLMVLDGPKPPALLPLVSDDLMRGVEVHTQGEEVEVGRRDASLEHRDAGRAARSGKQSVSQQRRALKIV